jgi:hypothetical protein
MSGELSPAERDAFFRERFGATGGKPFREARSGGYVTGLGGTVGRLRAGTVVEYRSASRAALPSLSARPTIEEVERRQEAIERMLAETDRLIAAG